MVDEPRNAASDMGRVLSELMLDPKRLHEIEAIVADDFVQEDRRKMIRLPDLDKTGFLAEGPAFSSGAEMEARERVVLAVRGDRLTLSRVAVSYRDGSVREFLNIGDFGGEPMQLQRVVVFDPDDLDAAIAELDRLHAEAESGDS